jgi:cytochrome c-type biogenesis protein CcmH/NrfF
MWPSQPNRDRKGAVLAAVLLTLTSGTLLAQNTSEDVRRVGSRLQCKCGCPHTVASCDMFECEFSKPAKLNIAKLKGEGVSDQSIIDQYIKQYGESIYRAAPNSFGWLVPYLSLIPGAALIYWFIRRYRQPRPLAELGPDAGLDLDDPALAKYKDQIEKDLARLDNE